MEELIEITNWITNTPFRETGEAVWFGIVGLVELLVWFLGKFGLGLLLGLVLGWLCGRRIPQRWLETFEEAMERNGW